MIIRPQYHFRDSSRGLLAWNIKTLIQRTGDFKIKNILLSDIKEINECFWYYLGGYKPTCRSITEHAKLIDSVDLKYPIILCREGRVMDGMHRVCKALIKGHETIKAVQFELNVKPDHIGINPKDLPYK